MKKNPMERNLIHIVNHTPQVLLMKREEINFPHYGYIGDQFVFGNRLNFNKNNNLK
jgi:hypothetical protein